jgi:carbonyl reductase 1
MRAALAPVTLRAPPPRRAARHAPLAHARAAAAMAEKRVLVTGANKGIGLALVERLLAEREDTHVLLGARDAARGAAARDALLAAHPRWAGRLEVLPLDVASDASVVAAAASVAAGGAPLHALVNNAGIAQGSAAAMVETNLRGVKRVTDAFAPLLSRADGRVVNISSASGPMFVAKCAPARQAFFLDGAVTWQALDAAAAEYVAAAAAGDAAALAALGYPPADPGSIYGFSKAALNVLTMQQAAALAPQGLRVNACSPGFIVTDLTIGMAAQGLLGGKSAAEAGALPPAKGTIAPWHLLFGEPPQPGGRYYGSDALRSPLDRYRAPGAAPYEGP